MIEWPILLGKTAKSTIAQHTVTNSHNKEGTVIAKKALYIKMLFSGRKQCIRKRCKSRIVKQSLFHKMPYLL